MSQSLSGGNEALSRKKSVRLILHIIIVAAGEKIFCEICNRAFTDSNRLKYHIRRVHQSGLLPCPLCGKEIKSHALNHHMKVVHSGKYHNTLHGCPKLL